MTPTRLKIVMVIVAGMLPILIAGAIEGGSRVVHRVRDGVWPVSMAQAARDGQAQSQQLFLNHSTLPFTLRPGARGMFMDTVVEVNASGYRGPALRRDSVLRVLAVGGSTTFDTSVNDEAHTWVRQTERLLQGEMPGLEMINGGLPMYGTADNAIKYILYDAHIKPDVVLIHQGMNDLVGGIPKEFAVLKDLDFWEFRGRMNRIWAGLNQARTLEAGLPGRGGSLPWTARSVFLNGSFAKRGANSNVFADLVPPASVDEEAPQSLLDKEGEAFRALVLTIRDNGAVPVFVPQSYGDEHRRRYPNRSFSRLEGGLRKLNRYYASICQELRVPILDVTSSMSDFGNEMFSDAAHFNNMGSRRFAELLSRRFAETEELRQRYEREKGKVHDRPVASSYMVSMVGKPDEVVPADIGLEMLLSKADGFDPPEGPYAQWKLPRVRWINDTAARLSVTTKTPGKWVFHLTAMTHAPKQEVRVRIDGKEARHHAFASEGAFAALATTPVQLAPGKHLIEIGATQARVDGGRKMALLVSEMSFTQADK